MYSNYVYETVIDGEPHLYHSLFKTMVKKGSEESVLKDGFFLAGQEKDALHHRVFSRENQLKFFYVPTWECSLRCPMCFVLKELEKVDDARTDPNMFSDFLTNYFAAYPKTDKLIVSYLGGEPLMGLQNCQIVNQVATDFANKRGIKLEKTITTNGTITLTDEHLEFLKSIEMIAVSVDGDEVSHNLQRKVFRKDLLGGVSPYVKALQTIRTLVKNGMGDRLTINSALSDEVYNDDVRRREYILVLMALGVKSEQVHIGTIVPTECKPKTTKNYDNYLTSGFVFPRPCCVFQYMSFFTLHGNSLHGNYYAMKDSSLGSLTSTIAEIDSNYKDYIHRVMPVLHDETCMKCPVIGFCWGGCNHSSSLQKNPSKHCNQELLELNVRKSAQEGTIAEFAEKNKQIIVSKKLFV